MTKRESGVGGRGTFFSTKIAIFLITLSGLILEVGLTRIYSASIWYHFAFVAISVALLGWGLGGFTVHVWKQARGKGEERKRGRQKAEGGKQEADGRSQAAGTIGSTLSMNAAAVVTLLYAAAIPLCLWLLVRYPFDMDRLPLYFLAPLLPFFLAGMALSIVFDIHRAVAGSLYFWDLIGASIGAVAVTLLLHLLGGEAALLAAAIAPTVAAFLLAGKRGRGEGEILSPATRAQENKINDGDPGVARSALTPGYSMSRLQRDDGPAARAQENKINDADPGASLRSAPGYSMSRLQRDDGPASRAQENKMNDADPGASLRSAPGYSMSRLQRGDGPASRAQEENKKQGSGVEPSPLPLPEGEGKTSGRGARVPSENGGQDARAPGLLPRASGGMLPRIVQVAAALGVVLAIVGVVATVKYGAFRVKPGTTKAMRNQMDATPGSHIVQTGWNAYSRIDCVEGLPNSFARLYIDSDAWTGIRGWDGSLESVQDMKWSYRALPFRLTPNAETMIIGPGGGPDVVAALASGSKKVTAVEMNPLMLKFVRNYGARAGNLYDRPDVETVLSEGRNFISRTDRKFDIILLGFVDSWASVASGGLSLSENYLYTAEAMRAYYDHLKPDGILVVLRWEMDIPRLTSNAVATLGASEAAKRVVVLMEKQANPNDYPQMLFMLRKQPFTTDQIGEMREHWTQANPIIMPDGTAPPGLKEVLAGTKTLQQYDAESNRYVGAVWDDSPFYFAIEKPWRMPGAIAERIVKWLLGPSMGMLALFAVFGKPSRRKIQNNADGASALPVTGEAPAVPVKTLPYVGSLVYFAALGFGFIAVELALLQHLTLLVGHPIYTLSVLLFTLLAFGGIGASLSSRWSIWKACAAVAVIGTIEALALPKLVPMLLWLPLWGRIAVAILMIAPLGLAMGMPFPRGLKQTGEGSLPAPPFYWGLNGVMSVIGSVTTVFVALIWGFQAAMLMGSACYVLAALASVKAFPVAAETRG